MTKNNPTDNENPYDLVYIEGSVYAKPIKSYWEKNQESKYNLLLKKSGIPKFYHDISFDDYKGEKSKENIVKIKYMVEHIHDDKFKDINLYLWGADNGTQKTATASNFAKGCIKKGLRVKYMNFGVFVNYLMKMQGFKQDNEAYSNINELKFSDIIMLDDCFDPNKSLLWKGENKGMIISEIDSFFRECIYNNKRFVLTSNVSMENMYDNYGVSLYELINRNFVKMQFLDSVKEVRKFRLDEVWKDMKNEVS